MVNFHSGGSSSLLSHNFIFVLFSIFLDGFNIKKERIDKATGGTKICRTVKGRAKLIISGIVF